ncbi:MAG: polysaccharide biosynthesis tyrosine autokinase [Anaerolineae bacterium]|nr:polysaccharide biosynthesis tyrosine autokinase [Anaerolineae bacterium]
MQYLKGTLRWWWLILLSTFLAAGISYYASQQQPRIYQTATTLMVGQVIQKTELSGNDFMLTEQLAESYAQMTVRQPILQAVVDGLGLNESWQSLKGRVYAASIPQTQLLAISVQDVSPERAVAIADELAFQLILQSPTSLESKERNERGAFVRTQLDDLEIHIQTAQTRIKELQAELNNTLSARRVQDLQTEISSLETLSNEWQVNYNDLLKFFEGGSTNFLTVIEPAQLPYTPVSPNVALNVILAAAVGFSLAFAAALLLEYLDNTIKTTDDFNSSTIGMTNLGAIKQMDGAAQLLSSKDLFAPVAEAYRQIRTNIQFTAVDQPARSIAISSAASGEGKSTTAANLAVIMAQAELRTIIVDADLRRPTLHKIFQVPNLGGLTGLLSSDELDIENQLKDTGVENLKIITSGPLPPNPSELLGAQRMMQLLQRLERFADVIIFDTPPILAVTDALVLSKRVDGMIIVVRAKSTRRDALKQSIERLNQVGAKLLGGILNGVTSGNKVPEFYQYYSHSDQNKATGGSVKSNASRSWWKLPVSKS